MMGIKENDEWRSNLGLVNIGLQPATVRIRLFNTTGTQIGQTILRTVPAQGWRQIDGVLLVVGAGEQGLAYATVEPTTAGATIWAYGSVVDTRLCNPDLVVRRLPTSPDGLFSQRGDGTWPSAGCAEVGIPSTATASTEQGSRRRLSI